MCNTNLFLNRCRTLGSILTFVDYLQVVLIVYEIFTSPFLIKFVDLVITFPCYARNLCVQSASILLLDTVSVCICVAQCMLGALHGSNGSGSCCINGG